MKGHKPNNDISTYPGITGISTTMTAIRICLERVVWTLQDVTLKIVFQYRLTGTI